MQQRIASLRDELSKKDQALRSITGKVRSSLSSVFYFCNLSIRHVVKFQFKQEWLNSTDPAVALQSCYICTRTYVHRRSILNPTSPTGDWIISTSTFETVSEFETG